MQNKAIVIQNLGKKYKIGAKQTGNENLISQLVGSSIQLGKLLMRRSSKKTIENEFWALRNFSLEIAKGDVIGIIGRNGAGKSTLLKLLSSITEPTEGRIELNGRVGSLLEVGTGFHSELTGRENVYLNGTILGMSRSEVKRKFDQIVDFAGIEQFIDTPVKHYSSGMAVRLGFAVAAHLEPEILIIDEVLSVGDVEFQRKSIGKMSEVASEGRTVLFVSHNLASVENLCTRGVVLEKGHVVFNGSQHDAIQHYVESVDESNKSLQDREDREGTGELTINAIQFRNHEGKVVNSGTTGEDIYIYLFYSMRQKINIQNLLVGIAVKSIFDTPIFLHHNELSADTFKEDAEQGAIVLHIKKLPLAPSSYRITYSLQMDGRYIDRIANAIELPVIARDYYKSGRVPPTSHGFLFINGNWSQIPNINASDEIIVGAISYE